LPIKNSGPILTILPQYRRTFDDATAEARYYRLQYKDAQDELEDLKLALQDFQASSKELEDEMEKDLAATEKREQELRNEAERLRSDLEGWKVRLLQHTVLRTVYLRSHAVSASSDPQGSLDDDGSHAQGT
jgi:seryl-tRNA synthetase